MICPTQKGNWTRQLRCLSIKIHMARLDLLIFVIRSRQSHPTKSPQFSRDDHNQSNLSRHHPSKVLHRREGMAAMATAAATVAGLGTPSLSLSRPSKKPSLTSGFIRSPVETSNPLKLAQASGGRFTCFERDWLRKDFNVIGFGLIGWIAPSSIPAIDGNSLTGLFFQSIGTELAHWPTGPALTSPFWLWMITWHLGLFLCLTFGQIGFKGRTDGYF